MKSYYLWNPDSNTWSQQAWPLFAILAKPGVTDERLLADATSNQVLTVAQARSSSGRKLVLTAPEHSLLKHSVPKTSPGKVVPQASGKVSANDSLSLEYKVLNLQDVCAEGRFDADALTYALNTYSRQGWHVHSCQMTSISSSSGEWGDALVLILQRKVRSQ